MIKRIPRANALHASSFLLSFLLAEGAAHAQDPETARAAQALYEQATAEMDAKSYPSACQKLEEVTRLVPEALGGKLSLAECYEARGLLASAWSQYALVEAQASKVGQAGRATKAAMRAAVLKPQLATLTLNVAADARALPGLAVTLDGLPVREAQWGTPLPVDVGGHEVVAAAPGRKPWRKQLEVATDGVKVSLAVWPLAPPPLVRAVPEKAPPDAARKRPWQRPAAIAVISVAAAGVGASAVLGGLAIAKFRASNKDTHCHEGGSCDVDGVALRHAAVGLGNASTVALLAGGVTLAGGVVLFFFPEPSSAPIRAPVRVGAKAPPWTARVEILPGLVQVRGAWQ